MFPRQLTLTATADRQMETTKEQFRRLFEKHEPELLRFADAMIEEFGRENFKQVKIWCPIDRPILPADYSAQRTGDRPRGNKERT